MKMRHETHQGRERCVARRNRGKGSRSDITCILTLNENDECALKNIDEL